MRSEKHGIEKGIYALIINVQKTICFLFKSKRSCIEPGFYIYIGSAHGPGGIKARVARHLRPEKRIRWHIDKITTSPHAKIVGVVYAPTEKPECILTPELEKLGFTHPIPGFGSSDCRRGCESHFFQCHEEPERCIHHAMLAFKRAKIKNIQAEI